MQLAEEVLLLAARNLGCNDRRQLSGSHALPGHESSCPPPCHFLQYNRLRLAIITARLRQTGKHTNNRRNNSCLKNTPFLVRQQRRRSHQLLHVHLQGRENSERQRRRPERIGGASGRAAARIYGVIGYRHAPTRSGRRSVARRAHVACAPCRVFSCCFLPTCF